MISDKEHRDVAERLRIEAYHWYDHHEDDDIFCMSDHDFVESILTAFGFDNMVAKAVVDVMGDGEKIGETIADLIDRPTCRNFAAKPADEFLCSKCGEHVDIAYVDSCDDYHAKYCPNCGAEVLDD